MPRIDLFLVLLALPACSLELAPYAEGMECSRIRRYSFPEPPTCWVRTSGPEGCYLLPEGDPCGEEPEVFYPGKGYESWCELGELDDAPILTMEVPCP